MLLTYGGSDPNGQLATIFILAGNEPSSCCGWQQCFEMRSGQRTQPGRLGLTKITCDFPDSTLISCL